MCKFKNIGLFLIALITIVSCSKLDELTEFDISDNFKTTLNINVTEDSEGEPQSWSQSSTVDLADNNEIESSLDLIQDVKINSLTFKIINFTGVENATAIDASLRFGDDTLIALEDINFEDSSTTYSVGTAQQLNTIANDLKNASEIMATVNGTVASSPVRFDVVIVLDVTTTIDVL